MFKLQDLWDILNYIQHLRFGTDDVDELDGNIKILAQSEWKKSEQFFDNTLDQVAFNSEDYSRLRNFLIDLYASHRTIATIQSQVTDIFSMPDSHLNELLLSFGFRYSLDISFISKANFFLDLVNMYKIKGTPKAVRTILDYYGFDNVEVAEYWLQRDESGELIFRSQRVVPSPLEIIPWSDIPYYVLAERDPHWMLTTEEAEHLIERNAIALPSKTPYFGLRPVYDISALNPIFAIISRKVKDEWEEYQSTGVITDVDIRLSKINLTVSFFELYLSCIYAFNTGFGRPGNYDSTSNVLLYTGDVDRRVSEIIDDYYEIVTPETADRTEREEKLAQFFEEFTDEQYELHLDPTMAGQILAIVNPYLLSSINSWIELDKAYEILNYLLGDLADWIYVHVSPIYASIEGIVLGMGTFIDLNAAVNFFKPYRARLVLVEAAFLFRDPLLDSIRLEDNVINGPLYPIHDWVTANSSPCCPSDSTCVDCFCGDSTSSYYSRETYDCGSYHDIGACWDEWLCPWMQVKFTDYVNFHPNADATAQIDWGYQGLDSTAADATSIILFQSGGFTDYDEGYVYDSLHGCDECFIYVVPAGVPLDEIDFTQDGNWDYHHKS